MTDVYAPLISLDAALAEARAKLEKPAPKAVSSWRALGAATLAAFSALTLAAAVILGPGIDGKAKVMRGGTAPVDLSHWQP
jgi:hypothetical protein